ncbi:hypothetical protein BOX15_Mlig018304g3, partial [Macrostomum lignano]
TAWHRAPRSGGASPLLIQALSLDTLNKKPKASPKAGEKARLQMEPRQKQLFASTEAQKLLKVKIQVCGRFLLGPEDDFGPEKAEELVRRVAKSNARVRTCLTVFNTGLRLGENGLFASMPLEHIKYQRIVACISPRQPTPQRLLTLCTRDFDQKCITVLQFKDPAALTEATRLIDKQRRLAAEEANYLPDTPVRQTATSNWAMQAAATQQQQQQQQKSQTEPRMSSFSADSGFPGFGPLERGYSQRALASQVQPRRSAASPEARVTVRASSVSTSMPDDGFFDQRQAAAHERGSRTERTIDSVVINYDDVPAGATYAVFESQNGPPTLLNERSVINGRSSGGFAARPGTLRVQTSNSYDDVDRVDGRRPQVTYVTNSQRSNSNFQVLQPQYSPPQQPSGQLVKLVPVRSRMPQHHHVYLQQPQHHRHQYYALQPVNNSRGSLGRGYFQLVTK